MTSHCALQWQTGRRQTDFIQLRDPTARTLHGELHIVSVIGAIYAGVNVSSGDLMLYAVTVIMTCARSLAEPQTNNTHCESLVVTF